MPTPGTAASTLWLLDSLGCWQLVRVLFSSPAHCYPALLSGLCSWCYSWGWEAGGALLGAGRCLPDTPAHGFLQLISLSLHGSSIQEAQGRDLWLFFSKYLALLQNGDINIYLWRLLLILKSICVKSLKNSETYIIIAVMICSSLTHRIQIWGLTHLKLQIIQSVYHLSLEEQKSIIESI